MDDATKRICRTEGAEKLDNATEKPAMQSEISKQIKPAQVLDKILKTLLTISVGEVLGTSQKLSQQLQDIIKTKWSNIEPNLKVDLISAAVITTRSKRPLI